MPYLRRKSDLLSRFEEAVRLSGWNILYLSKNTHPARYKLYRLGDSFAVQLYIWNISHGGKGRADSEYRIQVTGFDQFSPDPQSRNVVLGWWEDVGVFSGWDIRQHTGPLGGSSSMQVSEDALRQALLTGFAPYINQHGETAIAFRPDFIGTYLSYLEILHDSGQVPAEAEVLTKLSADPDSVADADIENEVADPRKYAIISTRKAMRALDFSSRILSAYGHRCAMCGVQLQLLDGAHILPVAHPHSTDHTSNGVALCSLHHRAYDRSLVTFDLKYNVVVNDGKISEMKAADRGRGAKAFKEALRPILVIPPDKSHRPSAKFVAEANELRGWKL